jgi:Ribbon-helix-helix protein, copG family
MNTNEDRSAELAAWAESDAPTVQPRTRVERGEAARESARAMLLAAAGDDPEARALIRRLEPGRPGLDPTDPGAAPMWKVRAPRALDEAMRERAAAEGRSLSELLRDAAAQYLASKAA